VSPQFKDIALLAAFSAALFTVGLGGTDLWAPDEPTYGEVARGMVQDGHWVLPHVRGEVYTDKPPLFFWLIAIVSLPFGEVSSWTARLPSALAGIASVLLTYSIGRRLLSRRSALAGTVIFVSSFMVFDKARGAQIDMLLCALILGALICWIRASSGQGRVWAWGFWIFCALAVLAKGPVGLILPLGSGLLFLLARGEIGSLRRMALVVGPALFLAIVGLWVAGAQVAGADEGYTVLDALRRHAVERFAEGMHHRKPFYYYLQALPRGVYPWTLFLPGALVLAWREARSNRRSGAVFLLSWFAFVFVFFSISTEKRDLYVFPLYPAVGLMIGRVIERVSDGSLKGSWWLRWPAGGTAAFMTVAGLAGPLGGESLIRRVGGHEAGALLETWQGVLTPARWVLSLVLLVGAVALILIIRRKSTGAVLTIGAGTLAVYLAAVLLLLPAFNPHKSARTFCSRIVSLTAGQLDQGERIGMYKLYRTAFDFYSAGVRYELIESGSELRRFLSAPPPVFLLCPADRAAELRPPEGVELRTIERGRVGHREYLLMASHPS
jgi:4-amino-4-deoxy-L-arabinose transferase-like glycosyltransferase